MASEMRHIYSQCSGDDTSRQTVTLLTLSLTFLIIYRAGQLATEKSGLEPITKLTIRSRKHYDSLSLAEDL